MTKTKSNIQSFHSVKKQAGISSAEMFIVLVVCGMVLCSFYIITTNFIFKSDGEAQVQQGDNGAPEAGSQERIMESVIEEYALKVMDEGALQGTFKGEAKSKYVRIPFNVHGTLSVTYRFYKGTFIKVLMYRAENWLDEHTIILKLSGTYEVEGSVLHYVITERSIDVDQDQEELARIAQEILRQIAAIVREPVAVNADNTISVPYLKDGSVLWMALEKQPL